MAKPPTKISEQEKQVIPHKGEPQTKAEFFHRAVNAAKTATRDLSKRKPSIK